ncbi:MAG: RecX family transcriptional regulator [Terriglobales bacterium]
MPHGTQKTALLDADGLYVRGVKLLAARGRAAAELERLLAPRAQSSAALRAALARLREHGYLDDRRFAEAFARYRREAEAWGPARCRRELGRRGVADALGAAAVAAAYGDSDEAALLAAYLRRKRLGRPETPAQTASLFRRLWHAGYSSAAIHTALRAWRLDPAWLDELDALEPADE